MNMSELIKKVWKDRKMTYQDIMQHTMTFSKLSFGKMSWVHKLFLFNLEICVIMSQISLTYTSKNYITKVLQNEENL